jgi:hypothetical protein
MAIAIFTFVARADIAPLYNYRSMSHIEWVVPMFRPSVLLAVIPVITLAAFFFAVYVAQRTRSPRAMIWFACLVSFGGVFAFSIPDFNCATLAFLAVFGVGVVTWIIAMVWLASKKHFIGLACLLCLVPLLFFCSMFMWRLLFAGNHYGYTVTVNARPGESYEEYLRRCRRGPSAVDGDSSRKKFTDVNPEKLTDEKSTGNVEEWR